MSRIIDDGEEAEKDIYAKAFPKAAKIKSSLKKVAKKQYSEFSEYPPLTDIDYDASEVQIQFAD